jgi:hypothetical protein
MTRSDVLATWRAIVAWFDRLAASWAWDVFAWIGVVFSVVIVIELACGLVLWARQRRVMRDRRPQVSPS